MSPKKRIETVGDLIAELTKYPSEAKLNLRCREMHCCILGGIDESGDDLIEEEGDEE